MRNQLPAQSGLGAALLAVLVFAQCGTPQGESLFTLMDPRESSIAFENTVTFKEDFNLIEYLYFYDGGGVALGDVNGDGLQDIFLTGNQVSNRLYLNRGELRFEDITDGAGVASIGWSTGATMADINGDGWLDLYVCQVNYKSQVGRNHLYINNRDGTFSEEAAKYGVAFEGLSTQAAFFDYDRDGDLDLYVLNHSVHSSTSFVPAWRRTVDAPHVGDRLYRNEGGTHFTNVTANAGIYSSALGYGLGLAVSDVNDDGWPDIYVGNDFHENDYLYLNRTDGTFTEVLQRAIGHTSRSTMGVDIADINNDTWPDIVALDMMPADWATYQASGGPDEEGIARIKRDFGYAPQVARNTLQVHRGLDAEGYPVFSEVGAAMGLHATDWSWTPLLADFDGDGWKDLFVSNGIPQRPTDLDYAEYVGQRSVQRILASGSASQIRAIAARMPAAVKGNYAFRNAGGTLFVDVSREWGLNAASVSNGAAHGDLDNDGDIDLVVNNLNQPASVYRNNSTHVRYLTVSLAGEGLNTTGIGARVLVYAGGHVQVQEQMPTRGFQSSVSHVLTFGLGSTGIADSLQVRWPDGRTQSLRGIAATEHVLLRQLEATRSAPHIRNSNDAPTFAELPESITWKHLENAYEDFAYEPLIPHRLSTQGPALAVADVNGDGQDDIFFGGAHGQAAHLLLSGAHSSLQTAFDDDAAFEDVDATFLDADNDRDLDLYVVRGGGEPDTTLWTDRLYINNGHGVFASGTNSLPHFLANGCCVSAADFDLDGDIDLFIGSRAIPGAYGVRPRSYLLLNDGSGTFSDATALVAPSLLHAGMVTGAAWADVTGNSAPDLVLVGEWMPITVLENRGGKLVSVSEALGLAETGGWWQSVLPGDFDRDGDTDLVVGNLGLNSVLTAPMDLYVHDFDHDGNSDPLLVWGATGQPWARRDAVLNQMPSLAASVPTNQEYSNTRASDLVELGPAEASRVHTFASLYLENRGTFEARAMPMELQWAPVLDFVGRDFDGDGALDLLAVGSFYGAGTAQGRYDASYGTLLLGKGNGSFVVAEKTGLLVRGEARSVQVVRTNAFGTAVVVAHTGGQPQVFRVNSR